MPRPPEEEGFLEKMLGPVPPRSGVGGTVRWVGDPIRTHLALMLNTRRGSVLDLPGYGLPDVSSYYTDYPASLRDLAQVVEELIRTYEPRLLNVRVRLAESASNEFRVSFLITGEVEEEDGVARVQYRTTISSSGQAELGE